MILFLPSTMKLVQATAVVILGLTTVTGASASLATYWPGDPEAVQHCISQSCGRVQEPATEGCWARCRDLPREKRRWEKLHSGQGFRYKRELEQKNRERVIGKRTVEDAHLTNAWSDTTAEEVEEMDDAADFGAHGGYGVLPQPFPSGIPEIVKEDTQEGVGDLSARGILSEAAPQPAIRSRPRRASRDSLSSYAQAILEQHNTHRANHSAPALTWSDNMAHIAQQIAESCVYAHNTEAGGGGYGQNIGAGVSPDAVTALITNEIYNAEIGFFPLLYGHAQPDMRDFESWGHFSQLVWKSTTSVGCATVDCSATGLAHTGQGVAPWFTVCNYSPPGNFQGKYAANVKEPRG
jgi:hypothetical protein